MKENEPFEPIIQMQSVNVWMTALFRPSVSTYESLLKDPLAGIWRALSWFLGFSLVNAGILTLEPIILRGVEVSWDLIILSLFISSSFVGYFMFAIVIIELVAQFLGGKGDFTKLFYSFSTFSAPLTVLITAFDLFTSSFFPFFLLPVAYGFLLGIVACKAVHQFGWSKAFISLGPIIFGFACLFGFAAIL